MATFLVLDGDNFFCSCERLFDASLLNRPVIVTSGINGCAIARSAEAKAIGIKMAQPIFQIKELIKKHDVQIRIANHILYEDISHRMMETAGELLPGGYEKYSVDELFAQLDGMENFDLYEFGQTVRQTTTKNVGIPVSVGIGATKTLAKLAIEFAKKHPGYKSVAIIDSEEKRVKALQKTDVSDVWGIGKEYTKALRAKGIITAWDFTQMPREAVRRIGGVILQRTFDELRGISCIELETVRPDKKSISNTRTFDGITVTDYTVLEETISNHAAQCAAELRKQHSCAVSLSVFIATNRHDNNYPRIEEKGTITFPVPTDSSIEIISYAKKILNDIFIEGYKYKRTGVIINQIVSQSGVQSNMFDTVDRPKHDNLMKALDSINGKYVHNTVVVGAQGCSSSHTNVVKAKLSPRYTTRIEEVIKVK